MKPAIQYMTIQGAETIDACVFLAYQILFGENKLITSKDPRVKQERIEEVIKKLTIEE